MSVSAGSDIESLCSKCGDVWHVVVAMVGTKVAKVQCKECNALHRYKPSDGTKVAGAAKKKRAAPKSRANSTRKPKASAVDQPTIQPDMSRPIRKYAASAEFQPADRIDHPKFGVGVVEAAGAGKVNVFFPVGRKVLAQAKPASLLERPQRFVPRGETD